jgi:hypothetical protein
MTSLSGLTPAVTYSGLLQVPPHLDASVRTVEDGLGNSSALEISTTSVNIDGTLQIGGISVTASATELNFLDRSLSTGYVEASKAVVAGTSREIDMSGSLLMRPSLSGHTESYINRGSALSSIDFSSISGSVQEVQLIGTPVTFNFYATTSGFTSKMQIIIKQDATGSRLVTWPSSVKWPAGSAPTLSTGGHAYDVARFMTVDGGTRWFGWVDGLDMR